LNFKILINFQLKIMTIKFYKYQGCGNDFILLDQRASSFSLSSCQIQYLCDRRFGIGADGLMELLNDEGTDFGMRYYNSDGQESSFCGNGGRCIAQFAQELGIIKGNIAHFSFNQTTYTADYLNDKSISLHMQDIAEFSSIGEDLVLDTGSPHYIHFTDQVDAIDLIPYARNIRYSEDFPKGINVNLVEKLNYSTIKMRTYERGVEDETLSCGTGVTAAAIAFHYLKMTSDNKIIVETRGGNFSVEFNEKAGRYFDIKLIGPALKVFEGSIEIQ
jgi:diaminopimelate epimerase